MHLVALALVLGFTDLVSAEPVCATKSSTTLRKGPGDQTAVSWRVAKYMPFLKLERKGAWVKVQDLDGEVHWARAGDVTTKVRCVVVKSAVAALHKEPTASSPAADFKTVDRYTPFLRVEDKDEMVRVKDEAGRTAWIQGSQVWKPVTVNTFTF